MSIWAKATFILLVATASVAVSLVLWFAAARVYNALARVARLLQDKID
jgi:hypothetical protein